MTELNLDEIRARAEKATPGPWERGHVWLLAGLIFDDAGNRLKDRTSATRCCYCHLGEPVWSGMTDINGKQMRAHRHRDPAPYAPESAISDADGGMVVYGGEDSGIVDAADAEFIAHAREDVPALIAEVDRLRLERECARASRAGQLLRARAAVDRVRKLHSMETDTADCTESDTTTGCPHPIDDHVITYCSYDEQDWPCATIRALDGEETGHA